MGVGVVESVESSVEIRKQALVAAGVKPKSAQLIAETFSDIKNLDDLYNFASSDKGKRAIQKRIRGTALNAVNTILEKNYGQKLLGKDGIHRREEKNGWLWLKEQNEQLLSDSLGLYIASEEIIEAILKILPGLRDFFGLFQMACVEKEAKVIISSLPASAVNDLNSLFFSEYGERPLPEKKKRGRPKGKLTRPVELSVVP